MKLIIGLGNPGDEYKKTAHNTGREIVDLFAKELGDDNWEENKKLQSLILKQKKVALAKPQTFMNNSGNTIKPLMKFFKAKLDDLLVIHDDTDLPLGKIKVQKGRGSAGHKGVQSIIDVLKSKNFTRMRIGVRSTKKTRAEKIVLHKFTPSEEKKKKEIIKKAIEQINDFICLH